jgi:HK97 family phage major capsid protein
MNKEERIRQLLDRCKLIQESAKSQVRDLTAEELDEIRRSMDEVDRLVELKALEDRQAKAEQTLQAAATVTKTAVAPSHPFPDETRAIVGQDNRELKPWETFGHMLTAVRRACSPGGEVDPRLLRSIEDRASGLQEAIDSEGGFLVDKATSNMLLEKAIETGVLVSQCSRQPIGEGKNGIKIPGVDETSRADGSRYGGIRAYWAAEAGTVTASKPAFSKITLELKKLFALCYATDELLEDAVALDGFIRRTFPKELGFKLDDAIVRGTGAGQPLGILNASALVSQAKETGQAAATVVSENLSKMYARLFAPNRANAVWLVNQELEPQFDQLVISAGTAGFMPYFVSYGPDGVLRIKGRPVIPIEQCSALGTVGDIILADFSEYVLAEKGGVRTDVSIHVRFLYGEPTYRFMLRIDGQPAWSSALTPYKGSNTLSPFVALATRS